MAIEKAIILSTRDFGEYDRMFSVLTDGDEKRSALARGVKKPLAKLVSILRPFILMKLNLVGKGRMKTIAGAEYLQTLHNNAVDLPRLALGYYFLEIVDIILHENEQVEGIFSLTTECLESLEETSNLPLLRSYFELKLLAMLGHRPQIYRDVMTDEPIREGESAFFSPARGGLVKAHPAAGEQGKVFRWALILLMRKMIELKWQELPKEIERPDMVILRETLQSLMKGLNDRRLRSLVFLRKVVELA